MSGGEYDQTARFEFNRTPFYCRNAGNRDSMMRKLIRWTLIAVGAFVLWTAFTDNPFVWPIRNTLEYQVTRAWWNFAGEPDTSRFGSVSGKVVDYSKCPVMVVK